MMRTYILMLIIIPQTNYIAKYAGTGFLMGVNGSNNNGYQIYKAPSVAAGAIQSFTQIMTIGYGTNNNVGIGVTSPGAKLDVAGTILVGNSGTSRLTDTSAFPLQLNRGLNVDVFGANGCNLGFGTLKGTTYIDGARIAGGLETNGTDGNFSIQTLGSSAYSTAITLNSVQAVRFNAYGAGTLVTDASGNITVSSGGGAGGPYLPVANPTFTGTITGPNANITSTVTTSRLVVNGTGNAIELNQSSTGAATYYVMDNTVETGGKRWRFGYSGCSFDKSSFSFCNTTDNIMPLLLSGANATFAGDITLGDDLNFTTNGFADISNTGTGAMRFKPSGQTLALTLTGANATFAGTIFASNNSPAYSFGSDTNTGIARTGTHQMSFLNNNSISLNLDAAARAQFYNAVTINGSSAPFTGSELDVRGDIVLIDQNWALRGNNSNADFCIEELGSSFSDVNVKLVVRAGGNVGIGKIDPQSKLQVAGGIQMADDTATPSATKAGTMRYRTGTEDVETGGELISNGNNISAASWIIGASAWTFVNGQAVFGDTVNNAFYQSGLTLPSGNKFKLKFTVSNLTSGSANIYIGNSFGNADYIGTGYTNYANGTYEIVITMPSIQVSLAFWGGLSSGSTFNISNVSLIELVTEDASYADMCMRTGSSTYEWVNIVRNIY